MNISTIGVILFSTESIESSVAAACRLARLRDAHVIGVYASDPIIPYMTGTAYDSVVVPEFLDMQMEEVKAIREAFEGITSREGVSAEFRGQETVAIGAEAFLLDGVRASDVIISPRMKRSGWIEKHRDLQEHVIRNSGRPVLVLPQENKFSGDVGRLMIGISPTREATRAAHDALVLARPGATIDLVSVSQDSQPGRVSFDFRQDLAAAFDRLGFSVNLVDRDGSAGEAGAVLLAAAAELGADLVATGAFGHSRTYDFVVGAATSYLLFNADIPVLYSK